VNSNKTSTAADPFSPATIPVSASKQRLLSIDILRGLTVAFMILVNNAGDGNASYGQLRHSVWNGCTLTDLVFPMFLFIMGVSLAISFESRLAKGATRGRIAKQILRRSAIIFLLGLFLNAFPTFHLATLRYFGVMQRIGLCYFFAGLALLYLRPRGVMILTICSLFGYWLLLTRVPVPGFGYPGVDIPVLDPKGNLASYLDRVCIPVTHRYHFSFYDPEGILSTIPSVATACLGILAGIWISRRDLSAMQKLLGMILASALMISAALVWKSAFPLNKRLWTSSYVFFAAGVSVGLLALFDWLIDLRRLRGKVLAPILAFGTNALTAYLFSELLGIALNSIPLTTDGTLQRFLYLLLPTALGPAPFRSLVWSCLFVVVCWMPVYYLRRRGLIIKL
jgi:predicted acyltransferase